MKRTPDLIVLHAGTNDLRTNTAVQVAQSVMKLALQMKTEQNDVMVSGLTARSDDMSEKISQVNQTLLKECENYNLHFINNGNIEAEKHLNGSGLHLNFQGTLLLAKNFIDSIKI